eukprot:1161026-Pelagomonas_calceolata.AAC.4
MTCVPACAAVGTTGPQNPFTHVRSWPLNSASPHFPKGPAPPCSAAAAAAASPAFASAGGADHREGAGFTGARWDPVGSKVG